MIAAALRDVYRGGLEALLVPRLGERDRLPAQASALAREEAALRRSQGADAPGREARAQAFREEYGAKYPKALAKLDRDWTQLTAFTTTPPSTGATCGPRTLSRAHSRPSGSARG